MEILQDCHAFLGIRSSIRLSSCGIHGGMGDGGNRDSLSLKGGWDLIMRSREKETVTVEVFDGIGRRGASISLLWTV